MRGLYLWGVRGTRYRKKGGKSDLNEEVDHCKRLANSPDSLSVNSAIGYLKRGFAHLIEGRIQDAISDFSNAIKLDGSLADAYANRGLAWNIIDRHVEALADFDQAIKIEPRSTTAFFNRGCAYMHLRDFERAQLDFSTCITLNSGEKEYYLMRATAWYHLGRLTAADADAESVLRIDEETVEGHYCKGIIKDALNDAACAIKHLTRAIELNEGYVPAYRLRSALYKRSGSDKWLQDDRLADKLDESFRID